MIEGIAITVIGGLIPAGALLLIRSLVNEQKREDLIQGVRRATCRHGWKSIPTDLGSGLVLVTADKEQCRKCGARSSGPLGWSKRRPG